MAGRGQDYGSIVAPTQSVESNAYEGEKSSEVKNARETWSGS